MKTQLLRLQKIIKVLSKLIPVLIEVISDLSDDGKLNNSVEKPKTANFFSRTKKSVKE